MKRILITGANGFIGNKLIESFENVEETEVIATSRSQNFQNIVRKSLIYDHLDGSLIDWLHSVVAYGYRGYGDKKTGNDNPLPSSNKVEIIFKVNFRYVLHRDYVIRLLGYLLTAVIAGYRPCRRAVKVYPLSFLSSRRLDLS